MSVRVEYVGDGTHSYLGDIYQMAEQVNPHGPIARWLELFHVMGENNIAGIEINDESVEVVRRS